jgi:hypothetical protein
VAKLPQQFGIFQPIVLAVMVRARSRVKTGLKDRTRDYTYESLKWIALPLLKLLPRRGCGSKPRVAGFGYPRN